MYVGGWGESWYRGVFLVCFRCLCLLDRELGLALVLLWTDIRLCGPSERLVMISYFLGIGGGQASCGYD